MMWLRLLLNFIALLVVIQSQICQIYPEYFPPIWGYLLAKYEKTKTIYIFGGGDSNNIYKWNIAETNGWFTEIDTKLPTDSFYSWSNNAVIIDNIVYFIGVNDGGSWNSGNIYTFDMDKEVFVSNNVPKPPYPSIAGCLSTNNTHIFMIGGRTAGAVNINQIQIYNVLTQTWSNREIEVIPINKGWNDQYCAMVQENNALYIFGGYVPEDINNYIDDIYKYDVIEEELIHIDNLPFAVGQGFAVYSSKYQSIYLVGGVNFNQYSNGTRHIAVFNTQSEKYMYGFDMITPVYNVLGAIVNDQIFAFGGDIGDLNVGKVNAFPGVQKCNLTVNKIRSSGYKGEDWWSVAFWIILALFIMSIISICCICYKHWRKVSTLNGELEALRINQRRYGSNDENGRRYYM